MKERIPPPRPSEDDFVFVQDLEFEDWGERWDDETIGRCQAWLKRIRWNNGLDPDDPDPRILAAYDAMYDEDVERTATKRGLLPKDLPDYRDAQRHLMQRLAIGVLQGNRRLIDISTPPRVFGKALQRLTRHLA
ncbi:hypothetical protein KJ781_01470 [Patescibacteria group bacterium]|nr:hypothetical protein [Patescibacteria group bacterium]MBU1448312.1 hypothetical protein [Patescibacteria group bacterium]MBU2613149.1 hypothetical protein [Patescibacteria group bacterium]